MNSLTEDLLNFAAEIAVDPVKLRVAMVLSLAAATAALATAFYAGQLSAEIFPPNEEEEEKKDRQTKPSQVQTMEEYENRIGPEPEQYGGPLCG